jgi:hypothetical protein
MGAVAAGMFEPLPDSAGFGQLCIEARLLSGYLRGAAHEARHGREDDKAPSTSPDVCTIIALAPFMDRKDLTELAKNALSSCGCVDAGVLVGLAPFMEHGEIGRIAREHMKGWFRASQPEPPSPTEAPAPPEPPDAKDEPEPVDAKAGPGPCCPSGVGERAKDVAERLRSVADRLARAEDPDERLALARELGELAREQTETARKAQA